LDLGPAAPIEEALAAWRSSLESGSDPGPAPARLRRLLWAPLEKPLAGAELVLISPDGPLGRLPWAALPGKLPGTVLLEEVPLALLPIPQSLPGLSRPAAGAASLLAVGGVDFGAGGGHQPLPASTSEAAAVSARFALQFKGKPGSLSGAGATKAAVRGGLTKHRFVHLATHGFYSPEGPRHSATPGPSKERLVARHPGLTSGLVLAGANRPTAGDDGVLTALEIAELDLSGMEMAVLSACETGLGKEAGGEGLLGLQRAFAVAGCRSVVSSLWSVDDAATAVLMERFYIHLWGEKLSKVAAMRRAQLEVMRHPEWVEERVKKMRGTPGLRGIGKAIEGPGGEGTRRSPAAWWAAWQLSGDWR